ncbi:caspase family protein [Pseudomonas sp. RIT288]|jgi:uncharacterized caspase-like protein|uniref:caspase family protein n=1 Tax=Pseudomonas sp. RIT288 TaxID=1470589 RepID=UPI00044BECE3|nr:caspase family protein [Pseudomonas sp. RIT288]EZP33662.1 putative protein containing caspase domain protein [Pseudomonas sp. RIT288]
MKSWAIVVGINVYHRRAAQKPLDGAVADACDFADWVLDPLGGNVPPERLFFWTYPWPVALSAGRLKDYLEGELPSWFIPDDKKDSDWQPPDNARAPKATEITSTIETVGRGAYTTAFVDNDEEVRRVYVFLAGHGIRARIYGRGQDETCFMAGDFHPKSSELAAGLVPCESFRKALLHERFNEALLFADCCRSEASRLMTQVQPVSDFDGDPIAPWGMAFAAQEGQPAYETCTEPYRGVFTKALMDGLRTHRPGSAGELYAAPLRDFIHSNIKSYTVNDQLPQLSYRPDPHGPLIVTGPAGLPNGPELNVSTLANGTRLILKGGDNKPVADMPAFVVTGPTLSLPPLPESLYVIEIDDGSGRHRMFVQPTREKIHVP